MVNADNFLNYAEVTLARDCFACLWSRMDTELIVMHILQECLDNRVHLSIYAQIP